MWKKIGPLDLNEVDQNNQIDLSEELVYKKDDSDEIQESPHEDRSYHTSRLDGLNRLSANASQIDLKSKNSRRIP